MNTKGSTKQEGKQAQRVVSSEGGGSLLEPRYAPQFGDGFITMLTFMLQAKLQDEHLKGDMTGCRLLELLVMLLNNQRYALEEGGLVSWWNKQEMAELVGDACRELDWEKFTTLVVESM